MRIIRGVIVILLLARVAAAGEAEWPGWRGPNRDGKSPDTGLLKAWPEGGPKLLWKVGDIGGGYSAVAVAGGRVYVTGHVDDRLILFAFDLAGKLGWKLDVDRAFTRSHRGSRATPTIGGERLYLLGGNGLLGCYETAGGKTVWTKRLSTFGGEVPGWGYAESVLLDGGLAIVKPGGSSCIVALDQATGAERWKSSGFRAGAEYSSCIAIRFEGQDLIVTGTRSGIVGVSAGDGSLLWSDPWSANNVANCPTPAYADGYIFWANGYGKGGVCLKLRMNNGRVLAERAWTTKAMNCHHGGYVIHEGHIYGNHSNGWTCLDLKTGERKWYERAVGKGSLCWADGMLYLFSESRGRGALATCTPDGFGITGRVEVEGSGTSWAHPVVVGGRLYLRYDTNLYCFDVEAR